MGAVRVTRPAEGVSAGGGQSEVRLLAGLQPSPKTQPTGANTRRDLNW